MAEKIFHTFPLYYPYFSYFSLSVLLTHTQILPLSLALKQKVCIFQWTQKRSLGWASLH